LSYYSPGQSATYMYVTYYTGITHAFRTYVKHAVALLENEQHKFLEETVFEKRLYESGELNGRE